MWKHVITFAVVLTTLVIAQTTLSFEQFYNLVDSSVQQNVSDKQLARFIKNRKMNFRLTEQLIEQLTGLGIGPRTLKVLRVLQQDTVDLPAPVIPTKTASQSSQPPPPAESEQVRIIDAARVHALSYTAELPNFVCLQVTQRYVDPSGLEMDWLRQDEIKTRVSYFESKENYEVLSVNNKVITDRSMHELGGATSTGEFGSMLAELFSPKTATDFKWARHSILRRRPVYVFHYQVRRDHSRWRIRFENSNEVVTAYRGLVYIDKKSEQVLRIAMRATGIPVDFPIQEARSRLDYDFVTISEQQFLLPLKAQMNMRQSKMLVRNNVSFRLYRKFSAEAILSFEELEDVDPLPADDSSEQ